MWLLEGGEVVAGISVHSSRAAVVLLHASPSLSAVLCLLSTLRVAKSEVEDVLGASSSASNDHWKGVVEHRCRE